VLAAVAFRAGHLRHLATQSAVRPDRLYSLRHHVAFARPPATLANSSRARNSPRSPRFIDSMKPFSHGIAGATGIAFPTDVVAFHRADANTGDCWRADGIG
jgi:hypothetical protein